MRRRPVWAGLLGLGLIWGAAGVLLADDDAKKKGDAVGAQTFKLKELSLEEAIKQQSDLSYSGERVYLGFQKTEYYEDSTKPAKEVKKYPKLKGATPLYGVLPLSLDPAKPKVHTEYQFVIDGGGKKYDRLYLDINHNLDLSDDPPLKLDDAKLPAGLWPNRDSGEERCVFEELKLPIDFGPGAGVRPVRILPILFVREKESATLMFAALTCRGGHIQIGDESYDVILAQPHWISGRFDSPDIGIYLTSPGSQGREYWWGSDRLGSYRSVGGKFYTLSATPMGDELSVTPFGGELGVFRVGAGQRKIEDMQVSGSLRSLDRAVAIGQRGKDQGVSMRMLDPVKEITIPVGDYTADYMTVNYGPLRISLSMNYHTDGSPRGAKEHKYAIPIRKDQPFVLDFSSRPEVMFASPAKEQVVHPGDEVSVKAVLVDPALDVMIRNLNDNREKIKKEMDLGDGKKSSYETTKSLDPQVTVTDSAGKKVGEGVMPFG